ncbi:SDR family oxidoreductase [Sinorhizobium chiapasense]|uniref:SDR family oxidoreductase n=1 Tax=Sinorhizobium chiapasense TaxID=501572 RepID=A0ABZ2BJK4_9HYPH
MSGVSDDHRVLVTAGANGIGLAIAKVFLRSGAQVYVCDIDPDALERASREYPSLKTCRADISSVSDVDELARIIEGELGGIDTLVNNAGIGGPSKFVEDLSDDDWAGVFAVNVTGTFNVVRRFVPKMKEQKKGSIINISTTSTRTGLPKRTPYVVSKFAIEGLTKNLTRELGPFNIRCNTISPGSIENERGRMLMQKRAESHGIPYEEALQQRLSFISMRTKINPTEIGEMALFLSSEGAKHVTGQCVSVCGNVEWED